SVLVRVRMIGLVLEKGRLPVDNHVRNDHPLDVSLWLRSQDLAETSRVGNRLENDILSPVRSAFGRAGRVDVRDVTVNRIHAHLLGGKPARAHPQSAQDIHYLPPSETAYLSAASFLLMS